MQNSTEQTYVPQTPFGGFDQSARVGDGLYPVVQILEAVHELAAGQQLFIQN